MPVECRVLAARIPTTLILLVEDDPDTRELYRTILRNGGYAVVAVEDGLAALRYLESEVPDAVVLDLGLPRLPGRDVHQEMAAQGLTPHIPIIVVTGSSAAVDEHNFACVLRKPIDPDDLIDAVQRCLRRQRLS
jgi:CheY-like chemotaxis protein